MRYLWIQQKPTGNSQVLLGKHGCCSLENPEFCIFKSECWRDKKLVLVNSICTKILSGNTGHQHNSLFSSKVHFLSTSYFFLAISRRGSSLKMWCLNEKSSTLMFLQVFDEGYYYTLWNRNRHSVRSTFQAHSLTDDALIKLQSGSKAHLGACHQIERRTNRTFLFLGIIYYILSAVRSIV